MRIVKTEKGYLTILTGKTDMGKSTITVFDCAENVKHGENVLFFSFEYCQSIIYNKLISHFGLKWQELFNLDVVDSQFLDLNMVVDIARKQQRHVDAIYVDYLDLVKKNTFPESELSEIDQIQIIVETLADLAKELNVKIMLLSQTGSEQKIEDTVNMLNVFSQKAKAKNVIKMFIEKGNVINEKIKQDNVSHIILVEGYSLNYYSTVNIKEIYNQ